MSDLHEIKGKPSCHYCCADCEILDDKQVGQVSDCHGVGFDYETKCGEIVSINSELRYISDWNE